MKQTLPILHNDETMGNLSQEKKQKRSKQNVQEKESSFERNLRKKLDQTRFIENEQSLSRQTQTHISHRYGSGHSITTNTGKTSDRRQRNLPPTNIYRSDGELLKPSRMSDISNQYGSDYSSQRMQRNILVDANPRSRKIPSDMFNTGQMQIDGNQRKLSRPTNLSDLRPRERENSRLSNLSKTDSMSINDHPPSIKSKIPKKTSLHPLPPKSPISSSIVSHPHSLQTDLPLSPSSHDENLHTHCRTYRLMTDEQPLDGRHVIPSTKYVIRMEYFN